MRTPARRIIRLSRQVVLVLTAGVMALMGILCSTAALAAGIQSVDILALLFFMGAGTALFVLVVWYTLQLPTR